MTHQLTGTVKEIVGTDPVLDLQVEVISNQPVVQDSAVGTTWIAHAVAQINGDTFTADLPDGDVLTLWQVVATWFLPVPGRRSQRRSRSWRSEWFALDADANLADVVAVEASPVAESTLAGLAADVVEVREHRAAVDQVVATSDGVMAAAVNDPASLVRTAMTRTGTKPVGRDELIVNVRDYGATGVGDDTRAILEAADVAGETGTLFFPRGSYLFTDTVVGVRGIRGEGRARTILRYEGDGTAIRPATALGVRGYHGLMQGFLLRSEAGGGVGIDLESHSVGMFSHLAVQDFATAYWLRSTVDDGGCLYNTFLHCEAVTPGIGWRIDDQSSNENRLIASRTNGATDAAVLIAHGNHNHLLSCAFESGVDGVRIEGGASSDANTIMACRFEDNSDQAVVVGAGVRDTQLLFNKRMASGGSILDNGIRTTHIPALSANAHTSIERNKDMGADTTTPVLAARDTLATAGTPTTFELQNERFGGKFMRGVRGGVERFAINAEGVMRPVAGAAVAGLPSPSRAGAGGMAFNTATGRPVWSDGVVWRYADGTAVV